MNLNQMSTEEPPLPADIASKIATDFAHEPLERVLAQVHEYQGAEKIRVIRCIIYLAKGSLEQLLQLIGTAQTDYRDVIYRAEYDREDRQVRRFDLPFEVTPSVEVYEWKSDVEARWLTTRREEDIDCLSFDGAALEQSWRPLEVEWILDGPGDAHRNITDCPNLAPGVPVLSARAIAELRHHLSGVGELLPLTHRAHEYFALNVTNVVDTLDEERCDLERFESTGRLMRVRAYAFREKALGQHTVFKDRRLAGSTVFVTAPFVRAVEESRLTGFKFRHVWPGSAQQPVAAEGAARRR